MSDGRQANVPKMCSRGTCTACQSILRINQVINRPRSIYQYSNMAPRLLGQTSIFGVVFFVFKSLLGSEGPVSLGAMLEF